MIPERITLYHGGRREELEGVINSGLDPKREFFLTPQRILAEEASNGHWPYNKILTLDLPSEVFQEGLDRGVLKLKDYLGSIPVEGCKEVVVKAGEGIELINRYLWQSRSLTNKED